MTVVLLDCTFPMVPVDGGLIDSVLPTDIDTEVAVIPVLLAVSATGTLAPAPADVGALDALGDGVAPPDGVGAGGAAGADLLAASAMAPTVTAASEPMAPIQRRRGEIGFLFMATLRWATA